jgi:hypothetical protein
MTAAIAIGQQTQPGKSTRRAKTELTAREFEQFQEMSEEMVRQKGLLNVIQAATYLEVSRERIYELMERNILRRYEFLGRVYLSFQEVHDRRRADIKSGRPKRSLVKRIAVSLKAATQTDSVQRKQGGYAGPYYRKGRRPKK